MSEKGFAHIILVAVVVVVLAVLAGLFLISKKAILFPQASDNPSANPQTQTDIQSADPDEPSVTLKEEYSNPFDSYQNPFEAL